MPHNKMLAQIEDELVHAKRSLAFWYEQKAFMAETTQLHEYAVRQVRLREAEVKQLVELQESLARIAERAARS